MLNYTIRRLVLSIPTLLFIALVIFLLLELAPGDPMGQMPLMLTVLGADGRVVAEHVKDSA